MKFARALIATGFVLAASVAPAMAADWGGVKDMGGGVAIPVPAPAPVPTYDADSDWYVGLMLGGNISQSASIKDSDINMPVKDGGDIGASPIFGLTFGRYITPSLRAEIAIDYTPDTNLTGENLKYTTFGEPGADLANQQYGVLRNDTVKLSRTTALFNLLYDFDTGTRFTPYVGVGGGFSWRRIRRSSSEVASCGSTFEFPDGEVCSGTSPSPVHTNSSSTKNQIDFAAAVQAGIATNLTESIIWDNGWQMLWEGGGISSDADSISGDNRITYKNAVLQQFRSGLRIKFD